MPRKSLSAAESALWAALAYLSKLFLKKVDVARGEYRTDLRIVGTVAGHDVDVPLHGLGTQSGPQTTAGSSGPSAAELWAFARCHIPRTRIAEVEAEAIALWTDQERLPGVAEEDAKDAGLFLKRCRAATSTTKAGAFTFAMDPDQDDLAAAVERDAAAVERDAAA
jgi:hypothetical protein